MHFFPFDVLFASLWLWYVNVGFPGGLDGKESTCNVGDLCSIPGLGRSPRGGYGNPLQYSCLENPMDGGAWRATVHGVKKSDMTEWLSTITHVNMASVLFIQFVFLELYTAHVLWNGEGNGNPLQYSCLENPMDGGAWWAAVHGVARSRTRLSDFTFTFHFHVLEKEMAAHSSVLAWRIPQTGEPGGLLSVGSHRVGHDWSDLAAAAAACALKRNKETLSL